MIEIDRVLAKVKSVASATQALTAATKKLDTVTSAVAAAATTALGHMVNVATSSTAALGGAVRVARTRLHEMGEAAKKSATDTEKLTAAVAKTTPAVTRAVASTASYGRSAKAASNAVASASVTIARATATTNSYGRAAKAASNASEQLAKANRRVSNPFAKSGGGFPKSPLATLNSWFGDKNKEMNDSMGNLPILGSLSATSLVAGGLGIAMTGVSMAATAVGHAISGIATGLSLAVTEASKLDTAMSRVRAVSMASRSEMARLTEQASRLGVATQFSAVEVGRAQEHYARAGFSTRETMDAIPASLALAAATDTEVGASSGLIAQTIRSVGFGASDAGRVSDSLVTAANSSNVDVRDLADAMKAAAPVFTTMSGGQSEVAFQDMLALSGILGDQGIRGTIAGTGLRSGYLAMAQSGSQALSDLGVSATDAETGNMRRMPEILADLRTALEGKSTAAQSRALQGIFGAEGASTFGAILNASPARFAELVFAMDASEGAAERTARVMQDNLGGDLEQLTGTLGGLGETIGTQMLPGLRDSAQGVSDFVGALNAALVASGIAETGFGGLGGAVSKISDGLILFMEHVAPRIASMLEMMGVLEDGEAVKFAESMAGSLTDMRIARAESDATRAKDDLANETISTERSLRAVESRVSGARGSNGADLATDVQRQLDALELGDLTQNPAVAAELNALRAHGSLSRSERGSALTNITRLLDPVISTRLAANDRARTEGNTRIEAATTRATTQIESTRVQSRAEAVTEVHGTRQAANMMLAPLLGMVMSNPALAGMAAPFVAMSAAGGGTREATPDAGRDQIAVLRGLHTELVGIRTNTATRPQTGGVTPL